MEDLILFTLVNVLTGVLIALEASNACLMLALVLSALMAPLSETSPEHLALCFTFPAMILGAAATILIDRCCEQLTNRTSP